MRHRKKALDKSLLRREGGMEEFHRGIDYLLASDYISGRVLPMDSGRHLR